MYGISPVDIYDSDVSSDQDTPLYMDDNDNVVNKPPIHESIRSGDLFSLRLLIDSGADINVKDFSSSTPLAVAAKCGYVDAVKLLIRNGVDPNEISGISTALWKAAREGNLEMVKTLVEHGADVELQAIGKTPIEISTCKGHLDCVKYLYEIAYLSDRLLGYACEGGNIKLIEFLLENGLDVNRGRTESPLHKSAKLGREDIVRLLITYKPAIDGYYMETPLYYAAKNGHLDVVKILVESGANKDMNHGWSGSCFKFMPFEDIIDHLECAKYLIENGSSVNYLYGFDANLLCLAMGGKDIDLVKLIIEKGGDINYITVRGVSPFQRAILHDFPEAVEFLIKKGARMDHEGRLSVPPIQLAVLSSKLDIANIFIRNGVTINSPIPMNGSNGILNCMSNSAKEFVLDNGIDLNIYNLGENVDAIIKKLNEREWGPKTYHRTSIYNKKKMNVLMKLQKRGTQISRLPKEILLIVCYYITVIT